MSANVQSASARIAAMFFMHCSVISPIVPSSSSPVSGTKYSCPDTYTVLPA